jgi:hypothetical protein
MDLKTRVTSLELGEMSRDNLIEHMKRLERQVNAVCRLDKQGELESRIDMLELFQKDTEQSDRQFVEKMSEFKEIVTDCLLRVKILEEKREEEALPNFQLMDRLRQRIADLERRTGTLADMISCSQTAESTLEASVPEESDHTEDKSW